MKTQNLFLSANAVALINAVAEINAAPDGSASVPVTKNIVARNGKLLDVRRKTCHTRKEAENFMKPRKNIF